MLDPMERNRLGEQTYYPIPNNQAPRIRALARAAAHNLIGTDGDNFIKYYHSLAGGDVIKTFSIFDSDGSNSGCMISLIEGLEGLD